MNLKVFNMCVIYTGFILTTQREAANLKGGYDEIKKYAKTPLRTVEKHP